MSEYTLKTWPGCVGSIYRIQVENFLTYEHCEIYPGPYLNLIYGPNGSGKSSIVCAICLGLGGKPRFLGRAKDLSDYIMHGKTSAKIEIDLYVHENTTVKIKRTFENKKNSSVWILNGEITSEKTIMDKVNGLGISVNNLCQVLPQDRVADFAKMNSKELLIAIEKCIDSGVLFELHRNLIEKYNSTKSLKDKYDEELKEMTKISNKVDSLKDEVEKVKEYHENKTKLDLLEQKYAWTVYENAMKSAEKEKLELKNAIDELNKEKKKINPLEVKLQRTVKCIEEDKEKYQNYRNELKLYTKTFTDHTKVISEYKFKITNCKVLIGEYEKSSSERTLFIKDLEKQIESLENELDVLKTNTSAEKINELDDKINELTNSKASLQTKLDNFMFERNRLVEIYKNLKSKHADLNNLSKQKLDFIARVDRDTYSAINWLRQNTHLFKEEIIEPMILHINMNDFQDAKYLECHIQRRDFMAFLCHNHDDMSLFIDEVRTKRRLKVSICPVNTSIPLDRYIPKVPPALIRRFGKYKYLKDIFKAPISVVMFLCQNYKIHDIPILEELSNEKTEALCNTDGISTFFTESSKYVIRKSSYSDNRVTNVSYVRSIKFLSNTCDLDEIRRVKLDMDECVQKMNEIEPIIRGVKNEVNSVNKTIFCTKSDKNLVVDNMNKMKIIEAKVSSKKSRLERLSTTNELNKNIEEQRNIIKKLYFDLQQYMTNSFKTSLNEENSSCIKPIFLLNCHIAKKELKTATLKLEISDLKQKYESILNNVSNLKVSVNRAESVASAFLTEAQQRSKLQYNERPDVTLTNKFAALPDQLEEIEKMVVELKALISCALYTDQSVLKQYETNLELLNKIKTTVNNMENSLNKMVSNENTVMAEWMDKLKLFVEKINSKFSYNFKRIDCEGSVILHEDKNKDYQNYGLEIWVKYRGDQSLCQLDSMRQSGGERSVATMLFLMALQHISEAPIRIVDEINQGMDEHNERAVFKIMVETIANLKNSQYFFLSPKSLPNLEYTNDMTILTVCNGPFLSKNLDTHNHFKN